MDIATMEHGGAGDGPAGGLEPERLEAPTQDGPDPDEGSEARDETAADGPEDGAPEEQDERAASRGPGEARTDLELAQELCLLLFASPEPLSQRRLLELLQRPAPERVRRAQELLAERLAASGLPIVLRELGGGWRLLSDPEMADVLARLKKEPRPERISPAALETLAIVAYRQPVTKAEVEAIRGVQSGPLLRTLVDRGLVRVSGRAEQPGSPLQYATTREFLDRFGLASLGDLPRDGELTAD